MEVKAKRRNETSPISSPAWMISRAFVILLISGLAGAALVCLAPGFGMDEQMLDPRLSVASLDALQRGYAGERNPLGFYVRFLAGVLRGDLGRSSVFGQPVTRLIRERASLTVHSVTEGLALGWGVSIVFAIAAALGGGQGTRLALMALSGSLLSLPSALLAMLCLLLDLPPGVAIAAVVFPRVFPHAYEQLRSARVKPHVVMARSRGLSGTRLFCFHVVPTALMPVVALAGVSVALAFGASIPIEALSDSPGIGQLAWRAALGRDLPVLVSITLLLTAITVVANLLADLVMVRFGRAAA